MSQRTTGVGSGTTEAKACQLTQYNVTSTNTMPYSECRGRRVGNPRGHPIALGPGRVGSAKHPGPLTHPGP